MLRRAMPTMSSAGSGTSVLIETVEQAAAILRAGRKPVEQALYIRTGGFCLAVRSDSKEFIRQLADYFGHVAVDACDADVVVEAYDGDVMDLDMEWKDWAREPGKSGRKDAYADIQGGRLLLKVRTGMVFLQGREHRIAAGPCRKLDNQVINFINSQYMNWLQNQGWLICHASGLDIAGYGIGMAGLSGGGKSTLMLGLMDDPDVRYVTNDRLFICRDGGRVRARGIPKLPRINPGTIVHNPVLHPLIDASRREQLLALPKQELWHLEEKYDVMINAVYGPGRIEEEMTLNAFVVLNWSHQTDEVTCLSEVELDSRRDLLPAVMKSPGPFFQYADGRMYTDSTQPDPAAYLDALRGVTLLEVTGTVDIPLLTDRLREWVNARRDNGGTC